MKLAFFFVVRRNCKDNEEDVYKDVNKDKGKNIHKNTKENISGCEREDEDKRDKGDMGNNDRRDVREDELLNIYEKVSKNELLDSRLKFYVSNCGSEGTGYEPRVELLVLTPPSLFIRTILFLIDLLILFFKKFLLQPTKLLSSEFSFISS